MAEESFGAALRRLRLRQGMSLAALSEVVHYSKGYISRVERGERLPTPGIAARCDEALAADGVLVERAAVETNRRDAAGGKARPSARTPAQVPRQLPATVAHFVGRSAQLADLERTLTDQNQAAAVVISAIGGMAGIGKTALALHFAHQVAGRFPHGQLYINMRGFDPSAPPLGPGTAIRHFLDALGVTAARIPSQLDAQAALYRSILADRKVLILLDNVRSAEQVRPLLPGTAGCLVLITSRIKLPALIARDGAHPIDLDVLGRHDCRELVASLVGRDRAAAEPRAVDEVILRCGRLPLALAIVGARAATRRAVPLAALAAELGEKSGPLAALSGDGDESADVLAAFSWSYRALSPSAARLFSLLGLHPGPDISLPAAASLAGLPRPEARPLLAELASAHLIGEYKPGRFSLHDLVRAYANDLAGSLDPAERLIALERMLDHYLHSAYAADRRIDPSRDQFPEVSPARAGVTAETAEDFDQARAWLTTEQPVLAAVIEQAGHHGFDSHACQLCWTLVTFLDRAGDWHQQVAVQRVGLASAERIGDPRARARSHLSLADGYDQLGRSEDALDHYQRSLSLCQQVGDHVGQALAHHSLAVALGNQDRCAEAVDQAKQALDLYRLAGVRRGQARTLNNLGWYLAQLGDFEQSVTACEQALAMQQELLDAPGQSAAWDSLGYAHHQLGHFDRAVTCYQRALDLTRQTGERLGEAMAFDHLGDAWRAIGNVDAARYAWSNALVKFGDLEHPEAHVVRAKLAALTAVAT